MTHVWTEEEGIVITLGPEAFAKVKAMLAKKQYRYEMTDTEIKLKCGVIRMSPDADPRDTGDFYADEMGL